MGIIAHVYRNPDQTHQTYINEYDEAELDRLETEGMLFFAEYESGGFRQVTREEVVNPTPAKTETFYFNQGGK